MRGLREEPATDLLSEMEGIPYEWNEKTGKYGIRIQRNAIPDYATSDFWEAVGMWKDWTMFGFPNAGGSLDQPALWMDIVRIMQSCSERMGQSEA